MKLRPFELALVIIFGILGIAALILLATAAPSDDPTDNPDYVGPVQIWGTLPASGMNTALSSLLESNELYNGVSYRFIPPEDFSEELTEALADGVGPDLILASQEELVNQRRRIRPIPYDSWPLRDIQDLYIDGALIHALSDGMYGYPMFVDPLMMYWNTDILSNNGFLTAPRTWEELVNVQLPALIDRSFDRTINRGVVALGVYDNVENPFGTFSTLLIQSGSQLVGERIESGDKVVYDVALNENVTSESGPLAASLSFYLRFNQPANTLYSWNQSFSSDLSEFISEDLVFYFGYGSEGREIERLNPNLGFDIAEVPQGANADVRRTYGKFYALSPLRSSDNLRGAFNVLGVLSSDTILNALSDSYDMVPTKRNLVTQGSNDTFTRVAYRSAPITYGWLSPSRAEVDAIFSTMASDVSENRSNVSEAVMDVSIKLRSAYE